LRNLPKLALLILDSYEDVRTNKTLADWIAQQLLPEVETSPNLAILLAGQQTPDFSNALWRDWVTHIVLEKISETDAWQEWVSRVHPGFDGKGDISTLVKATQGLPSLMASY